MYISVQYNRMNGIDWGIYLTLGEGQVCVCSEGR